MAIWRTSASVAELMSVTSPSVVTYRYGGCSSWAVMANRPAARISGHLGHVRRNRGRPDRIPRRPSRLPGAASGLLLQFVDDLGRLRLGEVVGNVTPRLLRKGVQVAALRSGHRFVPGDPLRRILLGVLQRGL